MNLPRSIDELTALEEAANDAPGAPSRSIVARLFASQAKKVRNLLTFRLKSADDADDAAQEVFLKLWRHERSGALREEATAYMFSAAYSVATDAERHRMRHEHDRLDDVDGESIPDHRPALDDERHWRDALALLVSELKGLPEIQRRAFVLHHFKGLNYAQIARKMGISTRTVERHMVHAHRELEDRMKEYL